MSLPRHVQSRLYHLTRPILGLVAAHVCSVVMVSRLFGLSRKTFDTYRHQAAQGNLASCDGTPRVHGSAQPQWVIDAGWRAKAHSPSFGTPRLANVLSHPGLRLAPNPVQRILRKPTPLGPPVPCPLRPWNAWEAMAPHVLCAMDICSLSPTKRDGCDRSLIPILDDHARTGIASGLSERQTVAEVVEVLQAAGLP